jgi:choline-sulfatase
MPNIPPGHLEQTHPFAKGLRDNFNTQDIPPEEARKARAAYYACCEFLDETVGDLLTLLERDGFLENTIIVYTTDHGEMAGEHGQWWKSSYYEAAARVPLIVWDRQLQQSHGARITVPVELNDLFPTLCARAGVPIPEDLDGDDLTNLMSGDTESWRDTAITEYWANQTTGPMRMLRTPRYKYVAFPEDESILFDLETDPDEFENLSGQEEYRDLETSLHAQLMDGFSWESVAEQMETDRIRSRDFKEPWGRGTPNQYTLPDGRVVDAETCLYHPSVRDEG